MSYCWHLLAVYPQFIVGPIKYHPEENGQRPRSSPIAQGFRYVSLLEVMWGCLKMGYIPFFSINGCHLNRDV